jgi:acyl-CoA synthetase (AMP-forming)/AMP-acid ligase II
MRVEQFLSDSATRFGKRAAVVAGGREHSYAELARSSDRMAVAFAARGVGRGARVALFMDDNFEAVVSAFAVLKAGGVVTPVDATTDPDALSAILSRAGVVAIVTEARLASVAAVAMAGMRGIRLVILCGGDRSTASAGCLIFEDVVGGLGRGFDVNRAGPASDVALLLQSAGPDGAPIEAILTHAEVIAAAGDVSEGARRLSPVLSFYGICQVLAAIRAGATLVLETPSMFRRALAARIEDAAVVPALAV